MEKKEYLNCDLCNESWDYGYQLDDHRIKERHILNYYLYLIENKWKKISKDRHGVSTCVTCSQEDINFLENKREVKSKVKPSEGVRFTYKITNNGKINIFLEDALLIIPTPYFSIEDNEGISKGNIVRIRPGFSHFIEVVFENPFIGSYLNVLALNFTTEKSTDLFTILKRIIVDVNIEEHLTNFDQENYISPYMYEYWKKMTKTHFGFQPNSRGNRKPIYQLTEYSIPREYKEALHYGLKIYPNMPRKIEALVRSILFALEGPMEQLEQNYELAMHALLYLEEYEATKHINQYNMSNVRILFFEMETVSLQVPGLGEKRPSLILGDILYARVRIDENTWETEQYQGQIVAIKESTIHIGGFIPEFIMKIKTNRYRFDVRFELSRNQIVRMHRAIDLTWYNNLMNLLIPKTITYLPLPTPEIRFFNKDVENNPEQKSAIMNIITGSSRPYPYIIFGPPGTGKTVTLVEAILQVVELKNSRVLACAPSNSACDVIASKLRSFFFKENEILRLHSTTRDWKSVPEDIKSISNYIHESSRYYTPCREVLQSYKIIVSTLMSSSRLLTRDEEQDGEGNPLFTHVFIDECGQAQETESLVAIGGQLGKAKMHHMGGQLILAGDPQQLGPICASQNAERLGLGVSLLERLMEKCPLYQKSLETGEYDPNFITKLRFNFRSHPSLLFLPNRLFYENDLEAKCPSSILYDPIIGLPWINNGKNKYSSNFPIIFHGCIGEEMRDGRSPSFINYYEIDIVIQYVKKLIQFNFPLKEVGIISPYARQVYKLKEYIRTLKLPEIEIGSTENFQGREKRLIIISTVRSIRNNLSYDAKFRVGFLADKRRFNVALTRAQSMNIIVGNPHILSIDKNWTELINYAFENDSYTGVSYQPRNEEWCQNIISILRNLSIS